MRFNTDNISKYGSIVFLETAYDVKLCEKKKPELSTRIALNDDSTVQDISQAIYRQGNKTLILFAEPEVLEPVIKVQYFK